MQGRSRLTWNMHYQTRNLNVPAHVILLLNGILRLHISRTLLSNEIKTRRCEQITNVRFNLSLHESGVSVKYPYR